MTIKCVKGFVSLVGAGPGDFELITLKGDKALQKAEVLIYDRLVAKELVTRVPSTCEKIYVGKKASDHTLTQEEINALLVEKALEGKRVVRLKGGDPYVFGRGGEEGEALAAVGISFEVIPGISSAIGGLAYAGIPITHRNFASSFHVITGHLKDEDAGHDWKAISNYEGTLVFLMGVSQLQSICESLIRYGKSPKTPAALVEWATTPKQRKLVTTLEALYSDAKEGAFKSPSVIVVGEVVTMHEPLDFISKRPLMGKKIAVTRGREQGSSLIANLKGLGAQVLETPMIRTVPLDTSELELAIKSFKKFTHIIFTSANGVSYMMQSLRAKGLDARVFYGKRLSVVGSATKEALENYGLIADFMPDTYLPEELIAMLASELTKDDHILVARARHGRADIIHALRHYCQVSEVHLYESVPDEASLVATDALNTLDYITFTSSSTVKHFFSLYGEACARQVLNRAIPISIGPITSETLRSFGVSHFLQAHSYTVEGIIEKLLEEIKEHDKKA